MTEDDLRSCLCRVWSGPGWSPDLSAAIHLSGATEVRLSSRFLRRGSIEILQRYRALLLAFPREGNGLKGIDETLEWLGPPPEVKAWRADEDTTE